MAEQREEGEEKTQVCQTCGTEVPLAKEMSLCPSCGSDLPKDEQDGEGGS